MKNYFTDMQNMPNRTCVVVFSEKKKEVEEKLMKMKRKYTVKAKTPFEVRYITDSDFKFKAVDMTPYKEEE